MPSHTIHVIDSHTEGEPTRVVIAGGPDLGNGSVADKLRVFRERYDMFRSAVCNEPRGSDAMVGAMLVEPVNPAAVAGVIFFNNVGYLSMCVHGTIGLAATLSHLGRIGPGSHLVETPVGDVTITVGVDGQASRVSVANVASYRFKKGVRVRLTDRKEVVGDVAWGGNWFFLIEDHGLQLRFQNIYALTKFAWLVGIKLSEQSITGANGQEIDHVELFGPALRPDCHSKNFVLCPGKAYDRSPCGTGTSAKLACLYADGKLTPGQTWRQESIIGSSFEGRVEVLPDGTIIPHVAGEAFITADATLILNPRDPFRDGIRS